MRNDTSARLAAVALMSMILLGTTAVAVGYMLNVQAAYAVEAGSKQVQVQIPLLQIQVQDPGSGSGGDKGGGSGDGGSNSGSDSGDHGGSSGGSGDGKGGQDSGSNDERNRHQQDNKDDNNNNNDNGRGQYCYSVTVTNPLNGKTRTVDVCFGSRSDCEQAQQSDPDSEGGCESHS